MQRLIGREEELKEIVRHLAKGRHTLIIGQMGCGKSALLGEAVNQVEKKEWLRVLWGNLDLGYKEWLVDLASQLHQKYHALVLEAVPRAARKSWKQLLPVVERMKRQQLLGTILSALEKARYLLVLDAMETLSAKARVTLGGLMHKACVAGGIPSQMMKKSPVMKRFYWNFQRVHINPLSNRDAEQLLEVFCAELGIVAQDLQMLKKQVLLACRGNPLMMKQLLTSSSLEEKVSLEEVRQLALTEHAGTRYIDHTPLLLVIGAAAVITRFIALGMGERTLYVLAGIGIGLFLLIRFFIYRGMRV